MRGRKGEWRKELAEWQKKGFQRVKINGAFHEIPDAPKLDKKYKHDIDVVVDRLVVGKGIASRLADSFEQALALADGIALIEFADKPLAKADTEGANKSKNDTHERVVFSQRFACPVSGFTIEEIEPRLFSFNAPAGACPTCDGLGTELKFEADLVVPDGSIAVGEGAIWPWARTGNTSPYYEQTLRALSKHYKFDMATPWDKLPRKIQDAILFGSDGEEITFAYEDGLRTYKTVESVRGRDHQHRAALARDRQRLGARGAVALPGRASLRGVRRLSPEAAGAQRQGRRQAHRRGDGAVDPRGQRLVRGPAEDVHAASRPRSRRASSRRSATA